MKVYERLSALGGHLPPGARPPSVELHSIDDVPVPGPHALSPTLDSDALRPIAQELAQELSAAAGHDEGDRHRRRAARGARPSRPGPPGAERA